MCFGGLTRGDAPAATNGHQTGGPLDARAGETWPVKRAAAIVLIETLTSDERP